MNAMEIPEPTGNKVERMAEAIRTGNHRPAKSQIEYAKRGGAAWEDYRQVVSDAIELNERLEEEAEIASRRATVTEKLITVGQEFCETGSGTIITAKVMDTFTRKLEGVVTAEALATYNKNMNDGSGKITHRDIAFIGCIHRLSVIENGKETEDYQSTSPFRRIREASVSFRYRDKAFDNRQIRAALTILEVIGFTKQTGNAKFNYNDRKSNTACRWTMISDLFWTKIFT